MFDALRAWKVIFRLYVMKCSRYPESKKIGVWSGFWMRNKKVVGTECKNVCDDDYFKNCSRYRISNWLVTQEVLSVFQIRLNFGVRDCTILMLKLQSYVIEISSPTALVISYIRWCSLGLFDYGMASFAMARAHALNSYMCRVLGLSWSCVEFKLLYCRRLGSKTLH